MSENEIGLREGRAKFGDLVNRAEYASQITYITRHGRRVAAIVPMTLIPQETSMTAKDIRLTLDRSGEDDGWNWAEEATAQWIDAAEKAGLEVEVVSIEVPDVNYDAAIVEVGDQQYRISVRNDEITAVPHGSKVTLISATSGDIMPERAVELAESDVDWDDLPDDAQAWATEQGYGEDEGELLYVVPGEVELDGYPTRVITL